MIPLFSALWLGILTSISPCPLVTNIAAISFLSKRIESPYKVFWSSFAYIFGRVITYVVLGLFVISSLVSIPVIARFLQEYMNKLLGPILIITGFFLIDILKFHFSGFTLSNEKQTRLAQSGTFGSFLLGVLFALSFCPISAAIFFGSLIPLALNSPSLGPLFPFLYGIGTGLPVLIFAVGISLGFKSITRWFSTIARFEIYTRKATGFLFILIGCYYIWIHILKPLLHLP